MSNIISLENTEAIYNLLKGNKPSLTKLCIKTYLEKIEMVEYSGK